MSTITPRGAALMAEYNRWMNERLYDAAARLDHAELAADKGAFFGSILGTLNHIAVADGIWLHRFAAHLADTPARIDTAGIVRASSLRDSIAPDLGRLRTYRRGLDVLIERWVATLTDELLASTVSYASMAGEPARRTLGGLLQHFFNHQTHHRGQVTTLLSQAGVDMGATDLVLLVPTVDGRGAAVNASGPRVGVGVIVVRDGLVLLGHRIGSHGAGTWALPGGHLEHGERVADCAAREVREEAGLAIQDTAPGPWSSDVIEGTHYVTLFVVARCGAGDARILEPTKCAEWRWCRWRELPQPLFQPLASLHASGFVPDGAV